MNSTALEKPQTERDMKVAPVASSDNFEIVTVTSLNGKAPYFNAGMRVLREATISAA